MIAKNEAPYLLEWIAYYRLLKFDEIVIYDNDSRDQTQSILAPLADAGLITLRFWPLGQNESPQKTAYVDAVRKAVTEWILFVDADEFIVLKRHKDVNSFLAQFDGKPMVTTIGCNWRLFGDAGLLRHDDGLVVERFTRAAADDFVGNHHFKSFTRVAPLRRLPRRPFRLLFRLLGFSSLRQFVNVHTCDVEGDRVHPSGRRLTMQTFGWGRSDQIELDQVQINHYYTKTPQEYALKRARGHGDAGENQPDLKYWYTDEMYDAHNRNEISDTTILNRLEELKVEIARLDAIMAGNSI